MSPLSIALGLNFTIFPVAILSMICAPMGLRLLWKRYLALYLASVTVTLILNSCDVSFPLLSLPAFLALNVPLLGSAYDAFVKKQQKGIVLRKHLGLQLALSALYFLNLALFFTAPGNELCGVDTAVGLYQLLSITLLAFAFEVSSKQEKISLQNLVDQRTAELTDTNEKLKNTLKLRDTLFKVVLHDIINPVSAQMVTVNILEQNPEALPRLLPRMMKFNGLILSIINQVRQVELLNDGKMVMKINPVNFEECLNDVLLVFEHQLKIKELTFTFQNDLHPTTRIAAETNAFTNSVMNNLISNAIKFSKVGSELRVRAFTQNEKVVIEVEDQGIGMPAEIAMNLFNPAKRSSRIGTNGERGSGYGLPLVKSYVDHFGGDINFESRSIDQFPLNHGTKITLTLNNSSHLH